METHKSKWFLCGVKGIKGRTLINGWLSGRLPFWSCRRWGGRTVLLWFKTWCDLMIYLMNFTYLSKDDTIVFFKAHFLRRWLFSAAFPHLQYASREVISYIFSDYLYCFQKENRKEFLVIYKPSCCDLLSVSSSYLCSRISVTLSVIWTKISLF